MDEMASPDFRLLFTSLLEALPLPVLVVDRSLVVCYYNRQSFHLFERSPFSATTTLDQVVSDPTIVQLVQRCIETGVVQGNTYLRGDHEVVWQVTVTPLHSREQHSTDHYFQSYEYFAIAIEDLSAVQRAERVQRDFLANISHELRTPLTSVRLLAETLEDAIDTDPDKAQEFVEKIEIEVRYLTDLVTELLELSSLEAGYVMLNIEPVEAEQLVREAMARMLPLAQRHRVTLRTEIAQGKTLVAADSKQIMRVLVNLVHNAIKFTPSGGIIVIGTQPLEGQPLQSFFVRDTGIGIRAEELPRIFERFYKTSRSRTRNDYIGPGGGGTGLGLAIARQAVEAHGGHLMAESTPGQGSVFTFTLPVAIRPE
jgi:two-component system phosphate regulon sensor histidine kinase PhoR